MRQPGLVRKMDNLGRVVIPREIRQVLELQGGDDVEMQLENGALVLRKFDHSCVFCGGGPDLVTYKGKNICGDCLRKIRKV